MKKDIVDIIFKEKYPAYKDNTNLQYEIETTEENHIIITLPKYPICLLTLWGIIHTRLKENIPSILEKSVSWLGKVKRKEEKLFLDYLSMYVFMYVVLMKLKKQQTNILEKKRVFLILFWSFFENENAQLS